MKIGRDKKVKWILASPEGWKKGWAEKVLTPVDHNGNPIKCENSKCEGNFDWSWTQHTAWRIDSKSNKDVLYLSVFDNGDARGMEQPPLPDMKYSRAVIYKIDQKKMTVEQIWEVGKELGHPYFSPVPGLTALLRIRKAISSAALILISVNTSGEKRHLSSILSFGIRSVIRLSRLILKKPSL